MNSDEVSDHELMRRFSEGEEAAFAELVRRYQRSVVSYLARMLGNPSRAEELGQEVFLRVFRHRASYTREAEFSTWCFTIAVNLGRDEIRSRRRRGPHAGSDALEDLSDDAPPAPDAGLERDELQGRVRRALARLPEPFREVLTLRDLEGRSYEEIAAVLGAELGTVKSRINRARLAFRDVYTALAAAAGEREETA